jgi:hypothetical protein
MKKLLLLITCAASLLCVAASAPTVVTVPTRFQCDPTFDASGNLATAKVDAFFNQVVAVGADTFTKTVQVSWDAVPAEGAAAKTVTITTDAGNSVTLTDRDVLKAVVAAAQRERVN